MKTIEYIKWGIALLSFVWAISLALDTALTVDQRINGIGVLLLFSVMLLLLVGCSDG